MKKSIFSILLLLFAVVVQAQIQEPVKFKSELKTSQAGEAEVVFTGTIDKGWHVYSTDLGDGGPISATFNVESISGAELVGKVKPVGKEVAAFDKLFEMKVRYFENTALFVQKLKLTGGEYKVEGFWNMAHVMMRIVYRLHKCRLSFRARRKVQPLMDRQPIRLRMPEM